MNERGFTGETPETAYSAAENKIEHLRRVIDKSDAAIDLLKTDAEALEAFIEESIDFVEIANGLGAADVAKDSKEHAMTDIESLLETRKKIATLKAAKASLETAIERLEAADAALTKLAERTDKSRPLN